MTATAACGGHRARPHGRADVRARPRPGPRRRALGRRRRTVAAVAATGAFAALAWSPSSQALQEVSSSGPGAARALAESTGPAASDESARGAGALEEAEAGASADGTPPGTDALRRVVVAENDTLWSLARAHAPSGTHPSVYARAVMEVNDVEDPRRLRAGEVLWLPVR